MLLASGRPTRPRAEFRRTDASGLGERGGRDAWRRLDASGGRTTPPFHLRRCELLRC